MALGFSDRHCMASRWLVDCSGRSTHNLLLGNAIGHVMQWTVHDNTATNNVWAIPSDILGPALGCHLLIAYRRMTPSPSQQETVSV